MTEPQGANPRQSRLRRERELILKLNQESDHVQVEAKTRPGSEPEEYTVTLKCRGIVGIDARRQPVYADRHVVHLKCTEAFPRWPPEVTWQTPIWHPNISRESRLVCVNRNQWLGAMTICDLVRQLFEMAQYKNYHAQLVPPYPLDREVATWVREVAEPQGFVNKARGLYVDDKPFIRPTPATTVVAVRTVSIAPKPKAAVRIVKAP